VREGPLLDAIASSRPDGHGVRAWSLYMAETRSLLLGVKDREAGNAHVPLRLGETCGARYRLVWDDGRVSRGYVERRLLESDPRTALANARAAAFDDPDSAWVVGPTSFPDVALVDPAVEALAHGETLPLVERLAAVRRLVAERGLRTWSGSFSATHARARVLSSAGLDGWSEGTSSGWHVTLNGEVGDGFTARAPDSLAAFAARLERLAATAELLGQDAVPPAPGEHPVLFHPHVVEGYVLGTLWNNLNGATVAHGEGHFRQEQFGADHPVLREDLGLRIDPLLPLRAGSYRFTSEGVAAAACAFIARGRPLRPVLDLKYARRMGLDPTPVPANDDTTFLEGAPPLPLDEAFARASGGALVLSVLGTHTQDSASGDFSLSAAQALVIGPAGPAGRLRGTISGNLFRLLSSDDLRLVAFEGEHTPGLLVRCRLDPR
jgi:PmbA protein